MDLDSLVVLLCTSAIVAVGLLFVVSLSSQQPQLDPLSHGTPSPTAHKGVETRRVRRNAILGGTIAGMALPLLHLVSGPQPLLGLLPWTVISVVFASILSLGGTILANRVIPHWNPVQALILGLLLGVVAYSVQVWAALWYALSNPVYYP